MKTDPGLDAEAWFWGEEVRKATSEAFVTIWVGTCYP